MKVSFFTNFLNAHMLPMSLALDAAEGVEFAFVARNGGIEAIGRPNLNNAYDFVVRPYESDEAAACARAHALEDDVVIFGHMAGDETLVKERMLAGKLTFRYAERILKRSLAWRFAPPKVWRTYDWYGRYRKQPYYILCAGAYAAQDFALSGFPLEKCLNWGYFPKSAETPTERPASAHHGENHVSTLLWAGRMIDWKHPDAAIGLAARLRAEGREFHLIMAGDGPLASSLLARVDAEGLASHVSFPGVVNPVDMPELMRSSDVFLFTSDRKEGWGVVLSEAMTQGCAVVANVDAGSSATLIRHGENGLFYDGSAEGLFRAVSQLLDDPCMADRLAVGAYDTMSTTWSAEHAVDNFLVAARALLDGRENPVETGPCAPAVLLREGWFKSGDEVPMRDGSPR